jgi:ATP-binding cassette subfamily C protein/ATP-binding cassette subfamily C protein EexD
MQSMILGLGAYLVIQRVTTVGAMFAASILLGRALQPVEQVVGSWRNLISARGAYDRVRNLLAANPPRDPALALPRPAGRLSVEGLGYVIPGSNRHLRNAGVVSNRPKLNYWARVPAIRTGAPDCRILAPS